MRRSEKSLRKSAAVLAVLVLTAVLLTGCGIRFNINRESPNIEDMLADRALAGDPAAYNPDGSYTLTFRYDKGGFGKMDLSQAYIAYYPFTVMDQIEAITGGDTEDIPPLPADAQDAIDDVTGAGRLEKIAVVIVKTVDDKTLEVTFTDKDNPVSGREYFFIIPNAGLAGSVIPG